MKDAPINLPEAAEALLLRAKQALTMSTATIGQRDVNAAIVEDIRAYLRAAPSPAEPAAPVCSECNGTGYVMRMTYGRGPDDYEQEIECPKCKGSGEPLAAPVQQEPVAWLIDENEPSEFVTRSANIGVHCKGQPLYTHPDSDLRAELAEAREKLFVLGPGMKLHEANLEACDEARKRAEAERDSLRALLQDGRDKLNLLWERAAMEESDHEWLMEADAALSGSK